ncbi:MAG: 3-hydroxyacyl-CoA dehydrogenase NAD-binding domain-containing protein, partial [Acidaminococcaceae bacterium]
MGFSKVMVIGAGQMGAGVAQVMAQSGITVVIRDIKQCFLDKGITTIDKNLSRSVAKGKLTEDEKKTILGRISCVVDLDKTNCDVDLVIEAATENIAIKKEIFKNLDELCPEKTILASNTSSVSITMLAATTKRPDKFVGMHFFNPAPVMKLVEVTKGLATSEETFSAIKALAEKVGKTPVKVNDAPGFVGNRIMIPMINEAIFTL